MTFTPHALTTPEIAGLLIFGLLALFIGIGLCLKRQMSNNRKDLADVYNKDKPTFNE